MKNKADQTTSIQNEKETNQTSKTLNPNEDTFDKTITIIGGGDPNLSPDAGKPLL